MSNTKTGAAAKSEATETQVKLTINGKRCVAQEGETVLDVARREGIEIPALCSLEATMPWGACRLCLVEIEGTPKLQAACTTWVADGQKIKTDTPRVRAKRESYLKMYLSDHNSYCEAPCTHACPTHIDIPGCLAALEAGDLDKAAAIVRADLPFPGILGRICPRYCEPVCRRADIDEPIAICSLHRALADHGQPTTLESSAKTGKRVAIVGAGPAGLSTAWFLTERGHQVTLYDAEAQPGGLLRSAVPEFRLPQKVLDQELQPLWDAGARFVGQSKFVGQENPEGLLDMGFDAVVIATGMGFTSTTVVPDDEDEPIVTDGPTMEAADFLRAARTGRATKLKGKVAIMGCNVLGVDAARTALRLGAEEVIVATKYDAAALPEGSRELVDATEEGVVFRFGDTTAAEKEAVAQGATLILARVSHDAKDDLTGEYESGYLTANEHTGRTATEGVFATRNVVTGAQSAIHGVAAGKCVGLAVDAWLRGQDLAALEKRLDAYAALPYLDQLKQKGDLGELGRRLVDRNPVWLKMGSSAETAARAVMPTLSSAERVGSLSAEVEKGLDLQTAKEEAKRCLQCVCPSLGECELQKLGVEYGITENPLVTENSRVRVLEPQNEHPFIRRSMERCISCGRCVRVCREIAGPACYSFTGRGFTMKVDTPYSDPLQLVECISCGRCVTACPTGALTFNERALSSFRVDESRCIMCRECVEVCPVDALEETDHFEQARARWHELVGQGSGLAGGHRMCAGCGAPTVVRQVLMGTSDPVVVSAATGCLEVSTTIYPYTSWNNSFIHTAFENSAATISGVETAFRALKKKGGIDGNVKFIAFGGDGGTYDIGLQSLSGAMERGHDMLYVCYDNGAYMNTGFQRSGATPISAWTTTSPVGKEAPGKVQNRKNLTELMIAHGLKYVAQASPHDPRDLVRKAAKALATEGPTFLNVLSPCPRGWRSDGAESIDLARGAVNACYWPLFEYEDGEYHLTYRPHHKLPLIPWLKRQGRFAHLFKFGFEEALASIEAWVDSEWEKLLRKCGEPSEAEWQEHLQANGCLLR